MSLFINDTFFPYGAKLLTERLDIEIIKWDKIHIDNN